MIEVPYPNTRYAEELDAVQQSDYEMELYGEDVPLEERELQEFKERCRKANVSYKKLVKFDTEYHRLNAEAWHKYCEIANEIIKLNKRSKKVALLRKKQDDLLDYYASLIKQLREECFLKRNEHGQSITSRRGRRPARQKSI